MISRIVCVLLILLASAASSLASVEAQAGPYRISLTTQPRVIPVGAAKIVLQIKDASGKAAEGLDVRAIARMPGMFMGEREGRANPVAGEPGSYALQASFPMGGDYEVGLKISGASGEAQVAVPVRTGQDTGEESGGTSWLALLPWVFIVALVIFVVVRMKRTDQQVNWRGAFNAGTIGGIVLLIAMFLLARYAVMNWRRAGSMTPIEAQVMEMNTPPPPGTTPVTLATVQRGSISETVTYSGQALGFVEQDVVPRVTGAIVSMSVYVGDRVRKGQVLARLDTSQLDPQVAERIAMMGMAAKGVDVAAAEYTAALQEIAEAKAEVGIREGAIEEAEAMLAAARQEIEAMLADVGAAEAEARFKSDELRRMRELFEKKAVSRSELQQAESEAADAQANLNAAKANVRRADAMIVAAQKKVRQSKAELMAHHAHVRSSQANAEAKRKAIAKEQAAVAQARAGLQGATAQRGYSELKSEVDGVITQRLVSPGTVVSPGQAVLKVAQISPIRLQANVPETDLARIRVGATLAISSRDGKGMEISARVSSVQPSLDPQSRMGIVEVVWPNANGRFLPGQFVSMRIEVGGALDALIVPEEAVQRPPTSDGEEKPFVWVATPSGDKGQFTVARTEVQLGVSDGKRLQILGGLKEGQRIVTTGAALVREGGTVSASVEEIAAEGPVVEVTASGYDPESVNAEVGKPLTITFIRVSEEGCGAEIVVPDFGINKPLPLNKPIEVTITPTKSGEIRFTCGMDMFRGKVVVR